MIISIQGRRGRVLFVRTIEFILFATMCESFCAISYQVVGSGKTRLAASNTAEELQRQAAKLREEASALRQQAENDAVNSIDTESATCTVITSPWRLPTPTREDDNTKESIVALFTDYRLYINIGREENTWMDPRWGASGRRMEWTLDVRFLHDSCEIITAPFGRFRSGFEKMACQGSFYGVEDGSTRGTGTVSWKVKIAGITDGDIALPTDTDICFALPTLGGSRPTKNLSTREGPVTIKQKGWHTGFWREENRILGVFRAMPLTRAIQLDNF